MEVIQMMDFLYFPENKLMYIPAVLTFLIFLCGAVYVCFLFKKISDREQDKFKMIEEEILLNEVEEN